MVEEKQKKVRINLFVITIFSLFLIGFGEITYAYFASGITNEAKVETKVKTSSDIDGFYTSGEAKLNIELTNARMQEANASNDYDAKTSSNGIITVSLKAGSGISYCTYDLAIISSGDEYQRSPGAEFLLEHTVSGTDGNQKFNENNIDSLIGSTITPLSEDAEVTTGIIGHYSISDIYDGDENTQVTTTQTWNVTSNFYNLNINQDSHLNKNYEHTIKVVNVNCSNNELTNVTKASVVSGDADTIGSEIAIGSENFYVISSDTDTVTMLAKYNLNVGENYVSGSGYTTVDPSTNGYNLQSSDAIGTYCESYDIQDENLRVIATYTFLTKKDVFASLTDPEIEDAFCTSCNNNLGKNNVVKYDSDGDNGAANKSYWTTSSTENDDYPLYPQYGVEYPTYVYDDHATIKEYVDNYKMLLEMMYGISINDARLLSFEEAYDLGCDKDTGLGHYSYSCLSTGIIKNNRTWIFDVDFYLGSSRIAGIYTIESSGFLDSDSIYLKNYGVRPVITIPKSMIED